MEAVRRFTQTRFPTTFPGNSSPFRHSNRRCLRAKPLTYDVVVYVPPPWYRRKSFKAGIIAGITTFIGGVELFNSCQSVPRIRDEFLFYKLRIGNVVRARPKNVRELKAAWAPPPKPLVGTDKRVEDVKGLITVNHQETMGAIRDIKKKKSWADWFRGR